MQDYYTNQTSVYNDNEEEGKSVNVINGDDEGNGDDDNDANEPAEK